MISRYTRPEMAKIWSDENRLKKMLEVEILAAEAMSALGQVPKSAVQEIRKKAKINISRIGEIESTVKHDVISFLTQVGETIGPAARYLHLGMTSSDVLDTALSVQMVEACGLIIDGLKNLEETTKALALKYKNTPTMGRTHGVHAEPTTFGLKVLGWYSEIERDISIMESAKEYVAFGKISGAVGTFAHLSPKVEEYVCDKLGLVPEPVSTQIIPRDRHAEYLCKLAIVSGTLERIAVEIRHLQRTEVLEAEEPFTKGQKGSSAMPHKRNPVMSENICGLARVVRGYAQTALENIALWHERDISHSSAERIILPDASLALDFMITRMNYILSGLKVYPENMKANMLKSLDTISSGSLLLSLVNKGLKREDAYVLAQRAAFNAREKKVSFETAALKDKDIRKHLSETEIKKAFDIKTHYANVTYIFKRTLGK